MEHPGQYRLRVKSILWLVSVTALVVVQAVALPPVEEWPASAQGVSLAGAQGDALPVGPRAGSIEPVQQAARKDSSPHLAFLPMVVANAGELSDLPFGLQIFGLDGPTLDKAAEVGAAWVRIPFYWSSIEPLNTTPDNYYWPAYYDLLADLSARDIQVILTLSGNPRWAATHPAGPIDKVDVSELVQFMRAAVAHYGQPPYNVKHWEFYNEPDNGDELHAQGGHGYFGNQPDAYVAILRAVYGPMKTVDPEAQVLFGGIAYDNLTTDGGPFVESFLDRVLEQGGGSYFDVMNFHYYPDFGSRWDPYGKGIIGKATFLRRKLAGHGVYKPFVCTEAGTGSDTAHGGSDELQSRYVVQVMTRAIAAELNTAIWFHFVDVQQLGYTKFGLLTHDLSYKPSYWAYQTVAQQLSSAVFERSLAPGEDGSVGIEGYEFDARFSDDRVIVAWTNDGALHPLVLQAKEVTVVEKWGGKTTVLDGDDGQVDGQVRVSLGPSPRFVSFGPPE
jgi:hypothetical protein